VVSNRNTLRRSLDAIRCERRSFFGAHTMGRIAPAKGGAMSRPMRPLAAAPGIFVNLLYFEFFGAVNYWLGRASPALTNCGLQEYACTTIINCQWYIGYI